MLIEINVIVKFYLKNDRWMVLSAMRLKYNMNFFAVQFIFMEFFHINFGNWSSLLFVTIDDLSLNKYMSVQELRSTSKLFRSLKIKVREKT